MRHTEVDAIRERLQQRLDEFTKRAGKIENDLRTPRNPDWEDGSLRPRTMRFSRASSRALDEAGQIQAAWIG